MGKWAHYHNKNKSLAPANEASHPWDMMACGALQGWRCCAVEPTMALTQELCDDREKIPWNSQMPSPYKAKLFFLMNLMWRL